MLVVTYAVALAAVAVAADHLFDEIHILHHTHYHNARSIGSTNTNTTLSLTHTHTLVLPAPSEDAAIIHSRAGEQLSFVRVFVCVARREKEEAGYEKQPQRRSRIKAVRGPRNAR